MGIRFYVFLVAILNVTYGRYEKIHKTHKNLSKEVNIKSRIDCHPEPFPNAQKCTIRGCLWSCYIENPFKNYPCCYFPENYVHYMANLSSWIFSSSKITGEIIFSGRYKRYNKNYDKLYVEITALSHNSLNLRILDIENKRFRVGDLLEKIDKNDNINENFIVDINSSPFYVKIARRSTGEILFDSSLGPIIYADQYLEISTSVASSYSYGIGQRAGKLLLEHQFETYSIFNTDSSFLKENKNLYGSHPYSLHMEKSNKSYGILFLNSNAIEIQSIPHPGLTYRTIGGILEFVITIGDTPDHMVTEYNKVIGIPILPPKWALGYHICKYGYTNTDDFMVVIDKMRKDLIPIDGQWIDIDVFDKFYDFTIGEKFKNIGETISKLHNYNMKFVVIIDAGISVDDHSWNRNIFIKQKNSGDNIVGKVWPGYAMFPDFTNNNTLLEWKWAFEQYYKKLQFDGIWLDMNEVSSFIDGSINGCAQNNNTYDYPPYMPRLLQKKLFEKTICMSSNLDLSNNYNLHNLFGYLESKATRSVLDTILNKNSLIISRSTFIGQGKYGGNWQGDNFSTWHQLYLSIPAMLAFNIFGIPFTGSDVCGFIGNSTEELCTRWTQMASFFPFIRNHNSINSDNQHPYAFSEKHTLAIKKSLQMRYKIIPYLQSLFVMVNKNEIGTVARPIFFNYPDDYNNYNIDDQFMLGDSLLIIPQLNEGKLTRLAYFPMDTWYSFDGTYWLSFNFGQFYNIQTPYDEINVFYRQCSIIPTQYPSSTVVDSEKMPLDLVITMAKSKSAFRHGYLCNRYVGYYYTYDDDSTEREPTLKITFNVFNNSLTSTVESYASRKERKFGTIEFFGFPKNPLDIVSSVNITSYNYNNNTKVLKLILNHVSVYTPLVIAWSL